MPKYQRMGTVLLPKAGKLGRREKDMHAGVALSMPPSTSPTSKQEARLGHLPEARLGQEAEETRVEDYPQYRTGLLRNPRAGEISPAPVQSFLRA